MCCYFCTRTTLTQQQTTLTTYNQQHASNRTTLTQQRAKLAGFFATQRVEWGYAPESLQHTTSYTTSLTYNQHIANIRLVTQHTPTSTTLPHIATSTTLPHSNQHDS